eukprot:m.137353 g.137353  ORF g.137353 m.137353 type:complete len:301 (-) comp11588_c0_seq1:97-999(-)
MNLFASALISAPLYNVKSLVKFGFEPIPEFPAKNWMWKDGFGRLSFFSYANKLKQQYGIASLFRGTLVVGLGNVIFAEVGNYGTKMILDKWKSSSEEKSFSATVTSLAAETISMTGVLIITQPFRVIVRNMIASIVDKNDIYNTTIGTIKSIANEFGLAGFFRGLVGDWMHHILNLWLVGLGIYFVTSQGFLKKYQDSLREIGSIGETAANSLPTLLVSSIVSYAVYPIHVAAVMSSIAGSSLELANPPYQPKNADFFSIYEFLYNLGGYLNPRTMFRGTSGLLGTRWALTPFDLSVKSA